MYHKGAAGAIIHIEGILVAVLIIAHESVERDDEGKVFPQICVVRTSAWPEQFLHRADIGARFEQMGDRVPVLMLAEWHMPAATRSTPAMAVPHRLECMAASVAAYVSVLFAVHRRRSERSSHRHSAS